MATAISNSVLKDDKFYIAIIPIGDEENLCIFDINSSIIAGYDSASNLQNIANATYNGIY